MEAKHNKENEAILQAAFSHFINHFEETVKEESTKAAQNGKKSLSGFFAELNGNYGSKTYGAFIDRWEDNHRTSEQLKIEYGSCANIYRVDRVVNGFIENRYGGSSCKPENIIYLSDEQIIELQARIKKTLLGLGFSEFTVKAVKKRFYRIEEKSIYGGLWGLRHRTTRHNDGIGKVIYLELHW